MASPIKNAFPERKARGRGVTATVEDHGKHAGAQRYGLTLDGADGRHLFGTHPDRFSSPGGLRRRLQLVIDALSRVLDDTSGTVRHVDLARETPPTPAPTPAPKKTKRISAKATEKAAGVPPRTLG